MKNHIKHLFFIIAIIFCNVNLDAQNTTACNNNIVTICPSPGITFTTNGGAGLQAGLNISNPGLNPQGPATSGCLYAPYGANPQWFLINIVSSGNLGFAFGASGAPNVQNGFLHWSMWLYTPNTCANIFGNTQAPVSCNFNCQSSGGTGMGLVPAFGYTCNYQPSIAVTQGQQYLILVSNGSVVTPSVPVSFQNTGTAGISCNPLTIPNATACPGQQAVVTGTWSGASNTTYTIASSCAPTVTQTSSTFSVSAPATCVFTVLASGTNGGGQPITATRNFTLTVIPTTTLSVAHATNYCYGSFGSFTLSPSQGTFYIVTAPSLTMNPTTNNIIILPGSGSSGLVSPGNNGLITFSANLATGCTATTSAQVNVAPDNFITFNPVGAMDICQNASANFNANMPTANMYTLVAPGPCLTGQTFTTNNLGNFSIPNMQPACAGIYTVLAYINYNGIQCLRQGTINIRVVTTHSIDAPASYTFCEGTQACLTASAVGASSTDFTWSGPTFTSNLQNPCISYSITASNPNMAGIYTVKAFFNNGFFTCNTQAQSNVLIVATPPVSVIVPSLICQGSTANLAVFANGATSYMWSGPNGFTSTITNPVIQSVPLESIGIYTVHVVYAIGSRTCSNVGYKQMTVVPVDTIAVSRPAPVCRPENVNLTAYALTATSYSWAGPNSYTTTQQNPTIYYAPLSATGVYTVYASFFNGGIPCMSTNTVFVSVNPVMTFTLPDLLRECYGSTITIPGPAGATGYTWTSSAGLNYVGKDLLLASIQPSQSGVYQLTAKLGPCPTSHEVQIEVISPISWSLTPSDQSQCKGPARFEVGATGGSENYAYDWNPFNYLNAPTGSVVTGNILGTTVFNVTARDIACPTHTLPHSFTVLIKQPPIPDLRLDVTEGCAPFTLLLNSRTKGQSYVVTYDFGGTLQSQRDSAPFTLHDPGVYTLKVFTKGLNNCDGEYTLPNPIVVFPRANTDIKWTPDIPTTTDNEVTFNPVLSYGDAVSYFWNFTGTDKAARDYDTSDVKNPMRVYKEIGKFPVLLVTKSDKGCIDTTVTVIEIKDDLNVFIPNSFTPNGDGINDMFMVKGLGFKAETFFLEIYDRWGHSVYSTKDISKGWDGTIKGITPSEGIYVYKVRIVGANGEGRKEYIGHVTLVK